MLLPDSTQRYKAILDSLDPHIAMVNPDGVIVAVNSAWERFARDNGLDPKACGAGTDYFKAGTTNDVDHNARVAAVGIADVLRGTRHSFTMEYPCHAPDEQRWFEMIVRPLAAPETGAVIIHNNITASYLARQQALQQQRQFTALIEHAVELIIVTDQDGTIAYHSPSLKHITGRQNLEGDSLNIFDLVHPDDLDAFRSVLNETGQASYTTAASVVRLRHQNGTWRWLDMRCTNLLDDDDVRGIVLNGRDITERRLLERERERLLEHARKQAADIERLLENERNSRQEAEASRTHFRTLFEGVADAIVVTDESRNMIDVNVGAVRMLGYDREELLTMHIDDVIVQERHPLPEEDPDATEWLGLFDLRCKNGSIVPTESKTALIGTGRGRRYLSVVRDISERVELVRIQQDFLAMVAHELGSPVASVRALAELIQQQDDLPDMALTLAQMIHGESEMMQRLVDDIRDVLVVERSDFAIHLQQQPLSELIESAVAHSKVALTKHELRVERIPDVEVHADPARIGQVLRNLLGNAAKYTPAGTAVVIRADLENNRVRVDVADNGPGIPNADLERIFSKFARGQVNGHRLPGAGLGLYLSRQIARAHGSDLTVTSEPHSGTTFSFHLNIAFGPNQEAASETD